jgi:hypothetical protein
MWNSIESRTYDAMYFTGAIPGSGSGKTITITSIHAEILPVLLFVTHPVVSL